VKSFLSTYRYFFERFFASLCKGNSKDCQFCFLVSICWFRSILYTIQIFLPWPCTLFKTILRTFSPKIRLADQSNYKQANKIFWLQEKSLCVLTTNSEVLLLVFKLYNRRKSQNTEHLSTDTGLRKIWQNRGILYLVGKWVHSVQCTSRAREVISKFSMFI
jgi:hypothetical protein